MLVHNNRQDGLGIRLWRQALYFIVAALMAALQLWCSGVLIMARRSDALLGCNLGAGLIWLWYARRCYMLGNFARMALAFMGLLGSVGLAALSLPDLLF
ncbi:hypothetical protein [Desulfovibrio sp. UIB00]|uniref:hypothetical protein n=1 Tax=Desulfovibrio sp. UIB00 TaxID=2804314 RepID=UPI001F0D20A4|nr:hypothetical protein [Desulfovibrio sp. UIB00]MCH5144717.1 hypothetical protein [Desulfovibrio sp. UIB00]